MILLSSTAIDYRGNFIVCEDLNNKKALFQLEQLRAMGKHKIIQNDYALKVKIKTNSGTRQRISFFFENKVIK
jgi:hypothetical protein